MKFGIQFKTREAWFGYGLSNGLSMVDSTSVTYYKEQREEKDKTSLDSYEGYKVESFHKGKGGVTECYTVFTNCSEKTVTVDMLASFAISGISADIIHRATSFWSAEGKLLSQKLVDLNMERSWAYSGIRIEKFGQTGSMPVHKWFPFLVLEDTTSGEFVGIQLYCASSWQMEVYRMGDPLCVCGGLADHDFGHWSKEIKAGESFTTPKAVVATGNSLYEVCDKLVKAQNPRIAETDKDMPVMFNAAFTVENDPSEENLERVACRLEGSGIKYLVIDAGWYNGKGRQWIEGIGGWKTNKELFPRGLKAICDIIKSHGMVPGIWFEFETVTRGSAEFDKTAHLLKRYDSPITVWIRRFWDMRDPWVQEYLSKRVLKTLKDSGFGYLKVDYNENIGIGCDGAESLGEGLRQTVCATQDFFRKIAKEIPELVIENCASGGHRLEPSMMELASLASFSDAHECKSIPLIAANLHRLIRPEQSQIWVVLRAGDDIHRTRYSLVAGFLGRMCLGGDIFDIPEKNWSEMLSAIAMYDKVKTIIRDGFTKEIRCTASSYNDLTGYQAVLRTLGDKALLIVHTFEGGANPPIDEMLEGYTATDTFGSELDGDFRGKLMLLSK